VLSLHPQIGLVVDAVNAVVEIAKEDIEPPPSFGARIRAEFIDGMGKIDNRFVILLDVAHVLSADDKAVLSQATNAGSKSAVRS
jgi:purine-binding chemotaxis protein CheW